MELKASSTLGGGKYKIEKILGQGGFGITYLALQKVVIKGDIGEIESNIKVTIKEFFMKDLCNRDTDTSHVSVGSVGSKELVDKFKVKFIKEAQNIAKLKHDHIIKVLDVFEENDTAYYVMEYIDGGSLSEHTSHCGALVEREAIHYIRQIADATRFIHEKKINHLDIKPANILLKEGAIAVLIDFGLAKQYDNAGDQTSSTPIGVSKGYAPIEQYKAGGVSSFSPASDIYSLGATLYKLVIGSTPPEAHDVFDSGLPELPAELSADIKKAITMAMQPSRNARPQTVAEFLDILGGAEDSDETAINYRPSAISETVKVAPPKAASPKTTSTKVNSQEPEQKPIEAKQKKSKSGLIIAVMAALLVVAGGYIYMNSQTAATESDYVAESNDVTESDYVEATDSEVKVEKDTPYIATLDADELYDLGEQYYYGDGVTQSYSEAVKWYRKAADQGDADAQFSLGVCYHNGEGVSQSYSEAAKWYRKAADQGDCYAQYSLAGFYNNGMGVTQSYSETVKWLRKAANQGYADAQNDLGACYYNGEGVNQDVEEAAKWFVKAAEQGNENAIENLKILQSETVDLAADIVGTVFDLLLDDL